MGYPTAIEWTDATWNVTGGCDILSPGCKGCYAMGLAAHPRLNKHPLYAGTTDIANGRAVWNGMLTRLPDDHEGWTWPLRWKGACNPAHPPKLGPGKPSLIFCGDMTDLFHRDRPRRDIDRVVRPIICSRHIGQLLTKRADEMRGYFEELIASRRWREWAHPMTGDRDLYRQSHYQWMPRLWLGCSAERQKEADERRPHLKALADLGFTTFVSYEPALGEVDWTGWEFLKQLIAGGMSGRFATPAHPDWFRIARDWCAAHDIAFNLKQNGEFAPGEIAGDFLDPEKPALGKSYFDGRWDDRWSGPEDHADDEPDVYRVGKKAAGRLLDGKTHDAFPEVV